MFITRTGLIIAFYRDIMFDGTNACTATSNTVFLTLLHFTS